MYSDLVKKRSGWLLAALVTVLLLAALLFFAARSSADHLGAESAEAIRQAVQRCALQCYAVEGVYPPNLAYLEENYGLQVNTADFYITYDAFASNLPPVIRVTVR